MRVRLLAGSEGKYRTVNAARPVAGGVDERRIGSKSVAGVRSSVTSPDRLRPSRPSSRCLDLYQGYDGV
jgi:hypothetical protein